MKRLLIILAVFAFSCTNELENTCNDQCVRLLTNDYDPSIYSDSEIVTVYEVGGYDFIHTWTKKGYQMYLDSIACGYEVTYYGKIKTVKGN